MSQCGGRRGTGRNNQRHRRSFIFNITRIVFIINYVQLVIHTVGIVGDTAHALERTGADEPFDGSVEPLHLIDFILPDHESRTGLSATDHGPQFLVSVRLLFCHESDIDLSKNICLHLITSTYKTACTCNFRRSF